MADFQIHGRMLVKTLKEQFFNEFGGVLRVYDGNKKAADDVTLASIRANDAAKGGELTCRANRTVGKFEKEMWNVFGIKVQVATKDDWVLVLDGITLNTIKEIPNNATRAEMEKFLAYKRKKEEETEEDKAENLTGNVNEDLSNIEDIYDIYWDMQYGIEQDDEIDPQYTIRELFSEIAYNADCDELDEFNQLANFVLKHNKKIEGDRMFAFLTFAAELLQGWIDEDDDEEVFVFSHEDTELFKGTGKELYEKYEKYLSDDVE